jgi:hypothetical protein
MTGKRIALYPFLLAAIPILAIYQHNMLEVPGFDLVRPLFVACLLTALALGLAALLLRRGHGIPLLAALMVTTLYVYPLLFSALHAVWPQQTRPLYVLPLWGLLSLLFAGGGFLLLRRTEQRLAGLTKALHYFAVVLCGLIVLTGAWHLRTSTRVAEQAGHKRVVAEKPAEPSDAWVQQTLATRDPARQFAGRTLPDIYYIILDGYPRGDILQTRFNYNNHEFLDWLRSKGFFVAEESHSNYSWTHLSLSATLNAEYLQTLLPAGYGTNAPAEYRQRYQFFVAHLGPAYILSNRVSRALQSVGYTINSLDTGYAVTRNLQLSWKQVLLGPVTQFEWTLLRKTALGPLVELAAARLAPAGQAPLNGNVRLLRALPGLAQVRGPKFVVFYVGAPHPPFCFDEHGGSITAHPVYDASPWLCDGRKLPGFADFMRAGYPRNVAGLNVHVRESLNALLRATGGRSVIIMQSDHGSHMGTDPLSAEHTDAPERFGVLNAIYFPPGVERAGLDPGMSSVNTFRVVLNRVLGCTLPMLEDHAWFSTGDLNFTEVTERIRRKP